MALALALGAMAVGELIVVPGLVQQHGLLDANALTRVAAPIHLRCAELALLASMLVAGLSPYWLRSRVATTCALLAVAGAATLRLSALPTVYAAWSQVDRVAQAPYGRLVRAEGLTEEAYWLGLGTLAALLVLAAIVGLQWASPLPRKKPTPHTPTLDDAANTTQDDAVADAA